MNTVLAYIRIFAMALNLTCSIGWLIIVNAFAGVKDERNMRHRQNFSKRSLWLLGIELQVEGQVPDRQALVISNHRSMMDPLLITSRLDIYPLSKAEVADYPVIGYAAKYTGVIFVDREKKSSRKRAVSEIEKQLKLGKSVLVFPEGTTSDERLTLPFRPGSIDVAVSLGIPVMPVVLIYPDSRYHWTDQSLIAHFIRQFRIPRTKAKMILGPPMLFSSTEEAVETLTRWIHDKLNV